MKREIKKLLKNDSILKEIISSIPYPEIKSTKCVFHDLLSCVIEQQIHYRSTKKLFEKLLKKADIKILTPDNFLQFEKHSLKDINLSIKKYETILNIVYFWEENNVNWSVLSDEEIKKILLQIKGVGNWSIEMILIYCLNRPNIFSFDDYHIKQIMKRLYNLSVKSQMKEIANSWNPYKSSAFLYLLEWKNFNKSK